MDKHSVCDFSLRLSTNRALARLLSSIPLQCESITFPMRKIVAVLRETFRGCVLARFPDFAFRYGQE